MASRRTSGNRAAFTLLEVVVSIALIGSVAAAGLPIVWEFYRANELRAERDTLAALLRFARAQSMANKNEVAHGVYADARQFVLFEGASYAARNQNRDKLFPRSLFVAATGTQEVVFSRLSGRTASSTMTLSVNENVARVSVNAEGRVE